MKFLPVSSYDSSSLRRNPTSWQKSCQRGGDCIVHRQLSTVHTIPLHHYIYASLWAQSTWSTFWCPDFAFPLSLTLPGMLKHQHWLPKALEPALDRKVRPLPKPVAVLGTINVEDRQIWETYGKEPAPDRQSILCSWSSMPLSNMNMILYTKWLWLVHAKISKLTEQKPARNNSLCTHEMTVCLDNNTFGSCPCLLAGVCGSCRWATFQGCLFLWFGISKFCDSWSFLLVCKIEYVT